MKEIETLVEEKAKESADMSKFIREGAEGREGRWDGALHVSSHPSTRVVAGPSTAPQGWWHPSLCLFLFHRWPLGVQRSQCHHELQGSERFPARGGGWSPFC